MPSRLGPIALVAVTIAAMLSLTTGVASAAVTTSELLSLDEIRTANDGMNSGAVEWSGATYNADSHVLLTVDDEVNAYEFQLNSDGTIDQGATPRVIDLEFGATDFEGVAWISGDKYAFLSEGDGEVIIATVPDASSNGRTTIDHSDVDWTFAVTGSDWGNLGAEGIAYDGAAFYVARELPSTLTKFDDAGNFVASVDLTSLADATGVAALQDGSYLVISHESRVVAHYDIDWDTETTTLLATRDADFFTQLEGIAVMGTTDVHLFGEDNTRKGNPGQTYAHLNGVLIPPAYSVSDINCSGSVNVGDALLIAQIRTGLITPTPGCGSGDHNGDGVVNLTDAIMIAQCGVGIANVGCPDVGVN